MRIAIIFDLTEPGGVQTCVFSLIKGLNRKKIIPILIWDQPPNPDLLKDNNVEIIFMQKKFNISTKFIKKFPDSIRYLLRPFNLIKVSDLSDEFQFIYSFTPFLLIDKLKPHLIYLSGPPLIPQIEPKSIRFKLIKIIYKSLIKPFKPAYELQQNANYVVNSQYIASLFAQAYNKTVDIVYPSNQLSFIETSIEDFQNRKLITFFSRIVQYKRPELILELAVRWPDLNFAIVGNVSKNRLGYYIKIKRLIKAKRIKNLELYTNLNRKELDEILKKTKFYFFPAINEHFGITTVEAISKGCIPFVHDSGGQKEIVAIDELRFKNEELFDKFDNIIHLPHFVLENYRKMLIQNCSKFKEEVFIEKILQKLLLI